MFINESFPLTFLFLFCLFQLKVKQTTTVRKDGLEQELEKDQQEKDGLIKQIEDLTLP